MKSVQKLGVNTLALFLAAAVVGCGGRSHPIAEGGYHELQAIESGLGALASDPLTNVTGPACIILADRYAKVLREVENHHSLDDIRSRISSGAGLTSRRPLPVEILRYYWWRTWRLCSLAMLYIAPAAAAIWFYLE